MPQQQEIKTTLKQKHTVLKTVSIGYNKFLFSWGYDTEC